MSSLQSKFQRLLESRKDAGTGASPETTAPIDDQNAARERERALARVQQRWTRKNADRLTPDEEAPPIAEWYPGARRIETAEGGYVHIATRIPVFEPGTEPPPAWVAVEPLLHGDGPPIAPSCINVDPAAAFELCRLDPAEAVPPDRLLFFDIETTGLGFGPGTCAFLVGAGYFEHPSAKSGEKTPHFVVEQFLLEDFCDEPAMLSALVALMDRFSGLVTYNGRSFDVPMMRTRCILGGLRPTLLDAPNLDLLPPARRLWKPAAGSASLGRMEEFVLGIQREDDTPGELIPAIFLDYAAGWRRRRMEGVVRHNLQDIVSMAALLEAAVGRFKAGDLLEDGASSAECVGLSALLCQCGRDEEGRRLIDEAHRRASTPEETESCARLLAYTYRREGRHEEAAALWASLVEIEGPRRPEYAIELAKHLEHRRRDFAAARRAVRLAAAALDSLDSLVTETPNAAACLLRPPTEAARRAWACDLERRAARLERRLGL